MAYDPMTRIDTPLQDLRKQLADLAQHFGLRKIFIGLLLNVLQGKPQVQKDAGQLSDYLRRDIGLPPSSDHSDQP